MNVNAIRESLLKEAKNSPNLLSDLAGLESYIAESYNNRSFIELLQNADDAKSSKIKITKFNEYLFVANDGRIFSEGDLESLCRSASSNKVRGENIGYRGIGFKSVVGFAKEIHIISGEMEITFSKSKTKNEIIQAENVPLIRIPHALDHGIKAELNSVINNLRLDNYTTIFIFSGITAREIELEFDMFDISSLLFLNHIQETDFYLKESIKTFVVKTKQTEKETILNIKSNGIAYNWLIFNEKETSIAFQLEESKIKKLEESKAFVHAFLPTEDNCGLGVLLNGDFSTDPSRKHLIYDDRTLTAIRNCGNFILKVLQDSLKQNGNPNITNAFIPFADPRMLQFKKPAFDKFLLEEMKGNASNKIKELKICPSWFNIKDYVILYEPFKAVNTKCFELKDFQPFVKYLGAKENTFHELIKNVNSSEISTIGCVQLAIQVFRELISSNINFNKNISNLKVLKNSNNRYSFEDIKKQDLTIDANFISLLIEKGLTEFDIKQVLNKYISKNYCSRLFQEEDKVTKVESIPINNQNINLWLNENPSQGYSATKSSAKRWRSAEENALAVLNSQGFNLKDVSKQNIGYDLEGTNPDGKSIQIEVKSITMIGQKFKLTNNEVAIAQEKRDSYFIAIVRQLENFIEIALIANPMEKLILNRQCVQWIWECSSYDYNPVKFKL